ncbi:MAG: alpha-hydroxy-acid oxidizing protein [Proteobacteria bacterium]|nr:alpha-hydroxy-acid oxidizing protein [Pseudomonadota bacterium]
MNALAHCYNIADLREAARRRLPKGVFEFVDRGTEDEVALRNNRAAFERIKLRPRSLVDVSRRSMQTTLFGKPVGMPLAIAPTGAAGLCWYHGELELAKAAAAAKVPFTLATGAMTSMEEIAKEAGGRLWMQLYLWNERRYSYELIKRAENAGFEALILTVDTVVSPNREYNPRNGFNLPFHPNVRAISDMLAHPRWLAGVLTRYLTTTGMPRYENLPEQFRRKITADPSQKEITRQDTMDWEDVKRLRDLWPRILMVKGIMQPDEAVRAVEYGADAVIVSNHGGRNFDSAMASIDALPDIVEAVGDRATVILDSGIRRGSDIAKALALGAKAVLVGRATLYGTAVAGQAGALAALNLLGGELDKTMAYTACNTIDEIGPDLLYLPRDRNRMGLPETALA